MADKKNATKSDVRLDTAQVTELDRLADELSGPDRRVRQDASHALSDMARSTPKALEEKSDVVVPALVDALFRPEAQTRWESLDALYELAINEPDLVEQAFEGAEASLFDESSPRVRIAAFRLLARLGASSPELSDKVWPLLDEAVQCFHGDQGYRDMLAALLELAEGEASRQTKDALVGRISFDAEKGRGYVKVHSAEVVEAARK